MRSANASAACCACCATGSPVAETKRARAPARLDHVVGLERAVGLGDRVDGEAELVGEGAHGGQSVCRGRAFRRPRRRHLPAHLLEGRADAAGSIESRMRPLPAASVIVSRGCG